MSDEHIRPPGCFEWLALVALIIVLGWMTHYIGLVHGTASWQDGHDDPVQPAGK